MKVLICGGRNWKDGEVIRRRIAELPEGSIVIDGAASGADNLASHAARQQGLHSASVPALWNRYGKRAGFLRNVAMLELEPDLVIAFSTGSNGTQHTINEARRRKIPVEVHGKEKAQG